MKFALHSSPATILRASALLALLGVLAAMTPAVSAQETTTTSLYDAMLRQSRQEAQITSSGSRSAELAVAGFVASTLRIAEGTVLPEEINSALDDSPKFCEANDHRRALVFTQCNDVKSLIRQMVNRETAIRSLGRDLQTGQAGSFESSLLVTSFDEHSFLTQMQAVSSLWNISGTENAERPLRAERVGAPDEDVARGARDALSRSLTALVFENEDEDTDDDSLIAAVWAERYGALNASDATKARWPEVQTNLENLGGILESATLLTEPLENKTVFLMFSNGFQQTLPAGVRIWAYIQKRPTGGRLVNVGLEWQNALSPTFPKLCTWSADGTCTADLPGDYGNPPINSARLCGHPLGKLGYLCRSIPDTAEVDCRNIPRAAPGSIVLTRCENPAEPTETVAGPAVCQNWAEGKSAALGNTPVCTVSPTCEAGQAGVYGVTGNKDDEGNISIILNNNLVIPAKYAYIDQLTNARRTCAGPANTGPLAGVNDRREQDAIRCRTETDSARAACKAMENDGAFAARATTDDGVPLNQETCTQVLTEYKVRKQTERDRINEAAARPGICSALPMAQMNNDELENTVQAISAAARRALEAKGEPVGCEAMLEKKGPTVRAAENAVNQWRQDICTPGNTVQYKNTIGNNQCYLSLCLTQSLRDHNLVPGQTSLVAGGTTHPFDACVPPPADRGSLTAAALPALWSPPVYNQALMLKQAQIALCLGGNPSPLCGSNTQNLLRADDATVAGTEALRSTAARQQARDDLTAMTDGLGQRIGNDLYGAYLQARMGVLQGTVTEAGDLLQKLSTTRFPTTLCPLNPADRAQFLQSAACSPAQPAP